VRHSHPEEFLSVDVGSKRVGIARGSSLARIAEPLKTVALDEVLSELASLSNNIDGIVVGLPRGLDGQETSQTKTVRQWVQEAQAHIHKPFYWQDEALTSVAAKDKGAVEDEVDAVAASVILQDFLDTPIEQRVRC
jgi:putative holliday junction resolvase